MNVENAKQINVVWTEGTTAIVPRRNWNVDQTITVCAVDDCYDEPSIHVTSIDHIVTSADRSYDGFSITDGYLVNGSGSVSIVDNDEFGVIITPQTVFVNESGGNATYQVKLSSCPYSNVTCTTTVDGKQIQRPADYSRACRRGSCASVTCSARARTRRARAARAARSACPRMGI